MTAALRYEVLHTPGPFEKIDGGSSGGLASPCIKRLDSIDEQCRTPKAV